VALFGVAHFVAGSLWSGPFWHEFQENYLFLFVSIFLIYKKNFLLFIFFSKQSKDFLFICKKLLVHYEVDIFGTNFKKIIFLFCFLFQFF